MQIIPIESCEDLERVWEELQEGRRIMDRKVQSWQAALKPGDHFGRLADGILIVGEIVESEFPEDRARLQQPHMRDLRLAKCWSELCLEGEMGTVHVAVMVPISQTEFDSVLVRIRSRGKEADA